MIWSRDRIDTTAMIVAASVLLAGLALLASCDSNDDGTDDSSRTNPVSPPSEQPTAASNDGTSNAETNAREKEAESSVGPQRVEPPAGEEPWGIDLWSGEDLELAWLEPDSTPNGSSTFRIRTARWRDAGGWSDLTTIVDGIDVSVNGFRAVSVRRAGEASLATWPQGDADSGAESAVASGFSPAASDAWRRLEPLAVEPAVPRVRFGVAVGGTGGFVWSLVDGESEELAFSPLEPTSGTRGPVEAIDDSVDPCASPDATADGDGGVAVVYRDEAGGIRVARRDGVSWKSTPVVGAVRGSGDACPRPGPAIALRGHSGIVGWRSVVGGVSAIRVSFSSDGGTNWGAPIPIASGRGERAPEGRVDVALSANAGYAVWLEGDGADAAIRLRRITAEGTVGEAQTVAEVTRQRRTGIPQVTVHDGRLVVAWVDPAPPATLQTAVYPELPPGSDGDGVAEHSHTRESRPGQIPGLELQTLEGQSVGLRPDGGPLLVNLWATWCEPCRREIPRLNGLYRELAGTPAKIVGIAADEPAEAERVRKYAESLNIHYSVRLASNDDAMEAFGATSLPATLLYDRRGRLVWASAGVLESTAELERAIGGLLDHGSGR